MSDAAQVTREWVERAVIGLQLCPFARAPHAKGQVRYAVSGATDVESLLADLVDELTLIAAMPPREIETTLLIHPRVLTDFEDHNEFLSRAEDALAALELEGVIQIASFHPDYRFAEVAPDDISNATNRSPYPTLHLLREESIEKALALFPDPDSIYEANIATMHRLGQEGWAALERQWRDEGEQGGS